MNAKKPSKKLFTVSVKYDDMPDVASVYAVDFEEAAKKACEKFGWDYVAGSLKHDACAASDDLTTARFRAQRDDDPHPVSTAVGKIRKGRY